MRSATLAIMIGLGSPAAPPAVAADAGHAHPPASITKGTKRGAEGQIHKATGQVTKVDFVMDELTIVHDPVASLSWPVMKMEFKVRDRKMLDRVKPGNKVDFTFVESGNDYVILDIQ